MTKGYTDSHVVFLHTHYTGESNQAERRTKILSSERNYFSSISIENLQALKDAIRREIAVIPPAMTE
jgi:hypothetical protein